MEKARNWKQKSKKNPPRQVEKWIPKAGKSRPGGGLGGLGGDLWKKNVQEAVLADFGRFWTARQGLAGHLEAILGAILGIFGGLGADLCKNG